MTESNSYQNMLGKNIHQKAYHFSFWFNERSVGAVHLVVEAAGVAQVVAVTVPSPERGRGSCAVDAFTAFWKNKRPKQV